jgi:hypothetical protein
MFFSQTVSTPCILFEKKGGVVKTSKEVLYELKFLWRCSTVEFVELLYGRVCVEQSL